MVTRLSKLRKAEPQKRDERRVEKESGKERKKLTTGKLSRGDTSSLVLEKWGKSKKSDRLGTLFSGRESENE